MPSAHRADARKTGGRELSGGNERARPGQERRIADPPTRPDERPTRHPLTPLRHPLTPPRHTSRRRTPRHTRQLDEGPTVGMEILLKKPFHARRTAVRQVVSRASRFDYLSSANDYLPPPKTDYLPRFPGTTTRCPLEGHRSAGTPSPQAIHSRPASCAHAARGAAHGGPRRVLWRLHGQWLDRGHGQRSHSAPTPRLPTHRQLDSRRRRTHRSRGHAGHRPAERTESGHAAVARRRQGAAQRGPGGERLRPRDPALQRLPAGRPRAKVCDGRHWEIPQAVPLRAAGGQLDGPPEGRQTEAL